MKKILVMAMGLVILGSVLTGCKSTTLANIVTEGNESYLGGVEKIIDGGVPTKLSELGITDTYETCFGNEEGDIVVNVDANVSVPDVEYMSIFQVNDSVITQVMLDKFITATTNGADIYSVPSSETHIADIENKLELFLSAKAEGKTYFTENSVVTLDEMIAGAEESLSYLKANKISQKIDPTMRNENGRNYFDGMATVNGISYNIEYNDFDGKELLWFYTNSLHTTPVFEQVAPPNYEIDKERLEQIDVLIKEMGYENMECVYSDYVQTNNCELDASDAYRYIFMRSFEGANSLFIKGLDTDNGDDANYEAPITDEYIEVILTEDAIAEISCVSPQNIVKTEVEQAELLSFEEICSVFEKMMLVKYPSYPELQQDFTIDEIELGYKKVQNKIGKGYVMVPVWTFNGTCFNTGSDWEGCSPFLSYLTINAIDGTITNDYVTF